MGLGDVGGLLPQAIVLSIFVLVGNPLIVMIILGLMGYRRRTGFMAGITVAQISEFSLVVVATALRAGHIQNSAVTLTTMVGVITMTLSTYLILYSHKIYRYLSKYLKVFERKDLVISDRLKDSSGGWNALLFGHNRSGSRIRPVLEKMGFKVLVIDFNPEEVELLQKQGGLVLYGDISDHELYAQLQLSGVRLIVSTAPDLHDNLRLLGGLEPVSNDRVVIVTAADEIDANRLYQAGADYVLIPKLAGGDYLAGVIEHHSKGWTIQRKTEALKKYLDQRRPAS